LQNRPSVIPVARLGGLALPGLFAMPAWENALPGYFLGAKHEFRNLAPDVKSGESVTNQPKHFARGIVFFVAQ
jgi:hypothetical protein